MNVAVPGASALRRNLAGLAPLFGWLALAFLFLAPAIPAGAEEPSSIVLNLRGDETPEAIRRMVDALSVPGRQVEIRVGGATAAPAAAPPAAEPASKAKPAAARPAPALSMADEEGFEAEVSALPARSGTTPDRSRNLPWASRRPGFSWPSAP